MSEPLPVVVSWRRGLVSSGLPSSVKLTALTLSVRMTPAGRCWLSVTSLARDASLGERTVRRALRQLQHDGWLAVCSGGGLRSNVYSALVPTPAMVAAYPATVTGTPAMVAAYPATVAPEVEEQEQEQLAAAAVPDGSIAELLAARFQVLFRRPARLRGTLRPRLERAVAELGVDAAVRLLEARAASPGASPGSLAWFLPAFEERAAELRAVGARSGTRPAATPAERAERAERFVRRVGWQYPPRDLNAELERTVPDLAERGRLLELAETVRAEASA